MRIPSPLVYQLGQAVGQPELDGRESALLISPELVPTVQLISPLADFTGFSVTVVQRQSFSVSEVIARAASQAATSANLARLGRGLWDVLVSMHHLANFTQPSDGSVSATALFLQDPDDVAQFIIISYAVATVPQHQQKRLRMLLLEDGWDFAVQMSATGVGQTHEVRTIVTANRLA